MATPFRLKRSAIEGKRPAQSDLQLGELALNTYDGFLYTEREGVGLATVTNLTPWTEAYGGASLHYDNSVGIGTTVPLSKLDVRGSIGGFDNLGAPHSDTIKVFTVVVATKTNDHRYKGQGSSLGYKIDGVESPFLTLTPGRTYRFDQSDNSNNTHQIKFYLESDKTTLYESGVTYNGTAGNSGAYTQIEVGDETPIVLHYQCINHGYMGNAIQSNANVLNTNYTATVRNSITGFDDLRAPHSDTTKVFTVVVASKDSTHRYQGQGSGLGYKIDGVFSPFLTLTPGRTYRFDQSDSSNGGHPINFYLEADKTTNYSTGVTVNGSAGSAGAYTQIAVGDETPIVLHYQCTAHGYMGNAVQNNSNVVNSNYAAILRGGLSVTGATSVTGGETTLSSATISDLTSGRVVLAGASGALQDSGNLLFNGTDLSTASLIVSDLTSGRVVLAGGSGAVNDSANLKFNTTTSEFEVVGHTILDSLNVSGLSTFSGNINLPDSVSAVFGTDDDGSIKHTGTNLQIFETTGNIQITNFANDKDVDVRSDDGSGGTSLYFKADGSSGAAILYHYGTEKITTTSSGISVSGNVSAVDGAFSGNLTVTGNVGIAGTLTYEDVSRVDAVGLSTFREGLFIPDNQKAQFGNAAGSADLELFHNGTNSHIRNNTGTLVLNADSLLLQSLSENYLSATANGAVKLFFDNAIKLETSAKGIKVGTGVTIETNGQATFAGVVTATKFVGDGSDLIGIDASALKFGGVVKAQANGFGVVVTGVTTSSGGFSGNLTGNVTGTASLATDLAINGTNQILYQDSNNDTDILDTGSAGQILQSNGAGAAPTWVTSAPAGAIEGISIRDENTIVGSANSISTINFLGSVVTADAAVGSGIATVTINAIAGLGVSEGSGSKATGATGLDFVGPVVSVDAVSNTGFSTIRVEGLSIKDEGSSVGTAGSITTLNFVGSGIAAAVSGNTATITSAGGASTDDVVALAIALG